MSAWATGIQQGIISFVPVRLRSLRFLNSPISARAKIFWGLIHQNKKRGISRFGVRAKYKPQELVRSTFRTTGSGMESPCGCSGKLYHSAGSTDNFVFLSACTFSVMQRGNHMGIRPLQLLPSDRRFRHLTSFRSFANRFSGLHDIQFVATQL